MFATVGLTRRRRLGAMMLTLAAAAAPHAQQAG